MLLGHCLCSRAGIVKRHILRSQDRLLLIAYVVCSYDMSYDPSLGGFRFTSFTLGLSFNFLSKKLVCCFARKRLQ